MKRTNETIDEFVSKQNEKKLIFTAGPSSLLSENLIGLGPCFGRGDSDYAETESRVIDRLKKISGHTNLVRMQGSASLALEIMTLNFLFGRVLVVMTGYYSERMKSLTESAMRRVGEVSECIVANWNDLDKISGNFDWVVACSTETSRGLKIPIDELRANADRLKAKLMLDATASIGLELNHELADAIGYSSCKGLFGLTGAAFISFNDRPQINVDSFYLDINNHINKMMTGPYHAVQSLDHVLEVHDDFRAAVIQSKNKFIEKMKIYLTLPDKNQPLLCTHVTQTLSSNDKRAVLYAPRSGIGGSVVCHLGEVHMGRNAAGDIYDALEFV